MPSSKMLAFHGSESIKNNYLARVQARVFGLALLGLLAALLLKGADWVFSF